ncbi:hypothetical protein BAE44_0001540, partial [Dichanthelium oligosanthes]
LTEPEINFQQSSDPSAGNYVVVLIHDPRSQLSFARAGHDRWTALLPSHCNFKDCVFKDGLLYALAEAGRIHAFDLSGPAVKHNVVMGEATDIFTPSKMYTVEAPCGDLLRVWKGKYFPDMNFRSRRKFKVEVEHVSEPGLYALEDEDDEDFSDPDHDPVPDRPFSYLFYVYRVDLAANKLVEVSSLGEDVLFLGHSQSLCLRSEEYPQLKANHVYFTDNCEHTWLPGTRGGAHQGDCVS